MTVTKSCAITLSLLLVAYIAPSQSTLCPPSGCTTNDSDDVEFIQRGVKVDSSSESINAQGPKYGFRLKAMTSKSGWAWDLDRIKLLDASGTELKPSSTCKAIASGSYSVGGSPHPSFQPSNVFSDQAHMWGGRKGTFGYFFIGLECDTPMPVIEIWMKQFANAHAVDAVTVEQLSPTAGGSWLTVGSATGLQDKKSYQTVWKWTPPATTTAPPNEGIPCDNATAMLNETKAMVKVVKQSLEDMLDELKA